MIDTSLRFRWFVLRTALAVCFIIPLLFIALAQVASAEPATPADTPIPVVVETVDSWDVGSGMIYWGKDCFADEFGRNGYLKRRPVAGGTQRTLEVTDGSKCDMPFSLTAEDDGVYYFDLSEDRVERTPLVAPYTAEVVSTPVTADLPSFGSLIDVAGDYVYWPVTSSGKVLRALRSGSAPETVATGLNAPNSIAVVGSTVYMIDRAGLWSTSVSCDTLPCNKARFVDFPANTTGHSLLYRSEPRLRYSIYWVQRTTDGASQTSSVRRYSCSLVTPCFIGGTPPAVEYTAPINWELGGIISDGTSLFWAESLGIQGNTDGKIKRKPLAGGDAVDIAVNQTGIDTRRLRIANATLYFARIHANQGIYSLPLSAAAILRDLAADNLEVTQAIQNLANAAPLVANKPTYVRAYGRQLSGPNTPSVDARLIGTRGGSPLPGSPLTPVNGTRSLFAGGTYDRSRLNDGWLFRLPNSWTTGNVTLQFEVDPYHSHTDDALGNNTLSRAVSFQNQPPVCVWTVPVRTHTPLPSIADPNFNSMVDQFERRWPMPDTWIFRDTNPVEELQVCWAGPFPYPCYGPYELQDGWSITNGPPDRDKVIISLWTRAQLSFNPDVCDDRGAPVHFMGMVHPQANNGGAAGYASTISKQSWVQLPPQAPNPAPTAWDQLFAGGVMAQELAHNFGRKHVDCGNPDDPDNGYPYPPCQISDAGADQYYGFDVANQTPIAPTAAADFMSYIGRRNWVSDYTWRALINKFVAVRAAADGPMRTDAGDSVFITGIVDLTGSQGELSTVLILPTVSIPPATLTQVVARPAEAEHESGPHATFTLRLLGPDGSQILERTLTLLEMDDHVEDADSALFNEVFAKPEVTVAKVQLLADGVVIDELTPGAAVPTVSIQQPAGGETVSDSLNIQWRAADADPDDRLLFTLQYSHDDGASWHTLYTDLPSTPTGSYALTLDDLGSIQGSSGPTARIRILASDGYNTGIATSQPFTVNNRKPVVLVYTPVNGQVYAAGATVILRGGATDPEDGGLTDEGLAWRLDNAPAGTGDEVTVGGLAPGDHTAQLTATDSSANSAVAQRSFTVAPLSIPAGSAPQMDGFCTDEAYATATALRPQTYGDGTQGVVHLLRTDDHLWVCLSELRFGADEPGAFAGVRVDVDNSRDPAAQSDDYGFFVGEDGDVFTVRGDGAGGFSDPGPGGLIGQVSAQTERWSAELRIDAATLGGWDRLVGMMFGHQWVDAQGDDYGWPFAAVENEPNTWALTALGVLPTLTNMDPFTATVGAPAQQLALTGANFTDGAVAFWNDLALATSYVDSESLTVDVPAGNLASVGDAAITVRATMTSPLVSNALTFQVEAQPPLLDSVTPASVGAGGPSISLTINGARFAADSQVLWDGAALPTTFVNSSTLTVQVDAARLARGGEVGVAVRNPTPYAAISASKPFVIEPSDSVLLPRMFLPLVIR